MYPINPYTPQRPQSFAESYGQWLKLNVVGKYPYRSSWKAGGVLILLVLSLIILPISCKSKQKAVELSTSTSATIQQRTATDLQAVIQWLSIPAVFDTLLLHPDSIRQGAPRFPRGLQAGTTTVTVHHTNQTDSSGTLNSTYSGHEFTKSEAHFMLADIAVSVFLITVIIVLGFYCMRHI